MFGKLFNKKVAPNPEPGPQLGMLMLRSGKGFSSKRIVEAWRELYSDVPIEHVGDTKEDSQGVAEFRIEDRQVMLAAMGVPIPRPEIEHASKVSWMWPAATEETLAHRAHAIALTTPTGNPVAEALDLSYLLAAAIKSSDSVGVYWGNGGMVHSSSMFLSAAHEMTGRGSLPVMLWVGIVISGTSAKGPFTLSTHGMSSFGHKELEIIDTRKGIGDLRETTYSTIEYLLRQGPVLKDGDTFGGSATEKFKVEHTTSRFREGEPVIRLHLP